MARDLRRVVLFSPGIHEVGGAGRRSRNFAEGFAERGWDVRVITRSATDWRPTLYRSGGITAVGLPGFGRRRTGAILYLAVAVPLGLWWCRRARGALAVQLSSQALAAGLATLPWRKPYLAFSTNTRELSEVDAVLSSRVAPLRRRLLRRARCLVAQTEDAASEFERLVDPDRVAVVPTPVRPVVPPPLTGRARVLFTGRFSWEKDVLRLVEAWRQVIRWVPDARLTLAGEGSAYRSVEAELRQVIAADPVLQGSVDLPGWLDDLAPCLREHDVFVLPSLTEGMSNSLVEAVAWQRVVVASDIPANLAVVGPGYPLLFPPGDTDALAHELQRALCDDAVRRDAILHLEQRAPLFHLDRVIGQIIGLLEGRTPVEA